jgi:hypothetical protein
MDKIHPYITRNYICNGVGFIHVKFRNGSYKYKLYSNYYHVKILELYNKKSKLWIKKLKEFADEYKLC